MRTPGAVQRYGLAGASIEGPDVAVGPAGKVTTGAVLPAFARQAVRGGNRRILWAVKVTLIPNPLLFIQSMVCR